MENYSFAVMYEATFALLHKVALATHKHARTCCVYLYHNTLMWSL